MYIRHPFIRENRVEYREYQEEAAEKAVRHNTLIVLPTGTGKTIIALIITAKWLELHPDSKIIFMAPTKPLLSQHEKTFSELLKINPLEIVLISGEISPANRKTLWEKTIIFATPQVVYNDIIRGYLNIKDNWLLIFDEVHRAVGNYPYVKIIEILEMEKRQVRVVALTASPGDRNKTLEIMRNMKITEIYILPKYDKKIMKYIYGYEIKPIFIDINPLLEHIINKLKTVIDNKVNEFNNLIDRTNSNITLNKNKISYTYLDEIRKELEERYLNGEIKKEIINRLKKLIYQLILIDKLLNYIESYSYRLFKEYLDKLEEKARRKGPVIEKEIIFDANIVEAKILVNKIVEKRFKYPKIEKLIEILRSEKYNRALIFTSIKQVAVEIKSQLNNEGLKAEILIGQKRNNVLGLTQREQIKILNKFKNGVYKILIATHIGEEGLDIAEVDIVIFYDNPISAIRRIQRIGRTGRRQKGKVYFLILRKTRDEARYWIGMKREHKLYQEIRSIRKIGVVEESKRIDEYIREEKPGSNLPIYVDYRERGRDIITTLKKKGINIQITSLPIGDYVIGSFVVERKTMDDFMASIVDGRIFKQAKDLKELSKAKPIIILEGKLSEFLIRGSINTYIGTVLSLLFDYNIPVYISNNSRESAELIFSLYRRVAETGKSTIRIRPEKKPLDIYEIQKFILAGIPGVDKTIAERLLKEFKTLINIANASPNDLMRIKGIGPELASRIYKIFRVEYLP